MSAMHNWLVPHNKWQPREEYVEAAARVIRSGHVAAGPEVAALERELAERFRPGGEAVCVSSGTDALELAIAALGLHKKERVYIPTYACASVYNAVDAAGVMPRVLDVRPDTFNDDGGLCDVVVDTYGVPAMPRDGIYISDITQSVGGYVSGKPCGSFGALSVISFGATKPLGVGCGGAVLGPADAIAAIRDRMDYEKAGDRFNFGFNDVQAAMVRVRLQRLDADNILRLLTAAEYWDATPRNIRVQATFQSDEGYFIPGRVWYRYVIRLRQVEEARARFAAAGIETIVPITHSELIHVQLGLDGSLFPNAESVARTTLSLPIWPGMSDSQVNMVSDTLSGMSDLQ